MSITRRLLIALPLVLATIMIADPALAQSRRGSNWSLHANGFGYGQGTRYHYQTFHSPSYGYGGGWGRNPYYYNPPYFTGYGGAAVYFPYGTPYNYGFGVNPYVPYSYYPGPTYNTWPYNYINSTNINSSPPLHPNLQEFQNQQNAISQMNDPNFAPPKPFLPSNDHARQEASNLVAQGKSLMEMHQFQRSLPKFKLAIQNAPDLAEPYFYLAANYLAINNADNAIDMIQRGLTQDPYWPFSNPTLSQFYGAENVALIDLVKTRVVEWAHDNVRDADRLFLLAIVLIFEQDFENSRLLLQTAQALNFNSPNRHIATLIEGIDSVKMGNANPVEHAVAPQVVPQKTGPAPHLEGIVTPPSDLRSTGKFPDPISSPSSSTKKESPIPPAPGQTKTPPISEPPSLVPPIP